MPVAYMSTELHKEHSKWRCSRPVESNHGSPCFAVTDMSQKSCRGCGGERSIQAPAVAKNGDDLGYLVSVDSNGTETWYYLYKTNGVEAEPEAAT
ncbi:hypothetical protein FHETE_10420 [Fusarium heterosporum]|uniref:Uncharacterized protein n=1 Tax=Fusarium heterosporum TaxID=42747 RepID=A0A8H5SUT9_FUSHE|nr:hypothetical protein FHETE_10420 [Fusarium heterosporum]